MKPAFGSPTAAGAFALLLLGIVVLPLVFLKAGMPRPEDIYSTLPLQVGYYPWIKRKIFEDKGPVDIAFVGSSHLATALHTPTVQRRLSEQLHREAVVFTLPWAFQGYDTLYQIAKDLLDRRKVHTIVIYDEYNQEPHKLYHRLFPIRDTSRETAALPIRSQIGDYGGVVLSMPRHLLSLVRPNPTEWRTNSILGEFDIIHPEQQLGAVCVRAELNRPVGSFRPYTAPSRASPDDAVVYGPATATNFVFSGPRLSPYAAHFARKIARLCQERGTQIIALHLPLWDDRNETRITERENWWEMLGQPIHVAGIPGARLYEGIPSWDLGRLFFERSHLNKNGQELFTEIMTPTLLRLYASSPKSP